MNKRTPEEKAKRHAEFLKRMAVQSRAEYDFKAKLEQKFDVKGHPKADLLWRLAWQYGHANGYTEVEYHYQDLMELIK